MKTLLHDPNRGFYYAAGAEWTEQVSCAYDFGDIVQAIESALNCGRPNLELHLPVFDESPITIRVGLAQMIRR